MDPQRTNNQGATCGRADVPGETSQSVDWYHEGEERVVEADGVQIVVRFVGRRGRRARIAIVAPAGATFQALDRGETVWSPSRSI